MPPQLFQSWGGVVGWGVGEGSWGGGRGHMCCGYSLEALHRDNFQLYHGEIKKNIMSIPPLTWSYVNRSVPDQPV